MRTHTANTINFHNRKQRLHGYILVGICDISSKLFIGLVKIQKVKDNFCQSLMNFQDIFPTKTINGPKWVTLYFLSVLILYLHPDSTKFVNDMFCLSWTP